MKSSVAIFTVSLTFFINIIAFSQKTTIYLLPGVGANMHLYDSLKVDSALFNIKHIVYPLPSKKDNMASFAQKLLSQINTTENFVLIGTSLGGMLAAELGEISKPQKIIIISSAKNRSELPFRYRFQKAIPVHLLVPSFVYKISSRLLQPIVEPDRKRFKATFVQMLKDKKPKQLKRTVGMIMEWNRTQNTTEIIQIHGTNDHTLPFKNIKNASFIVQNGSHMMTLTRFEEIQKILDLILKK